MREARSPAARTGAHSAWAERARNLALGAGAVLLSLGACEVALRVFEGRPVFELRDYRAIGAVQVSMQGLGEHDPLLGWRLKSHLVSDLLHTIEHGVRKNDPADRAIRTGGILAVGDSFAAGSEVMDHESWPAQLERKLGVPVINAAAGGYGTDQIVMRAEQMLPIVRPATLLVGFLQSDIPRTGLSMFGRPKPYFTIEGGELVLRNTPVPIEPAAIRPANPLKVALGYSALADRVMGAVAPLSWYASSQKFVGAPNDPIEVTCRLLQRLKTGTDATGVRTLLVMQYGASIVRSRDRIPDDAAAVITCAGAMGIQVVDEFESLRAVFQQNAERLRDYYVMTGEQYGHMSAHGNEHIARLVAAALAQPAVRGSAAGYAPDPVEPGDGVNLLEGPATSGKLIAAAAFVRHSVHTGPDGSPVWRLEGEGGRSEHYVVVGPVQAPPGAVTLTLEIRPEGASHARVQLLDEKANGIIATFDFASGSVDASRNGSVTGPRATLEPAGGGWFRIRLGARLPVGAPRVLVQLAGAGGALDFAPPAGALLVRAVRLERGEIVSRQGGAGPRAP
jgi:hypothetical protein